MKARTLLSLAAARSALAAAMLVALCGEAFALDECGTVNTASNPQTATCTGAFNPYPTGVTYDENTLAPVSQGNVQVKISGTAAIVTAGNGVSVTGVNGLNADLQILAGGSVTSGLTGGQAVTGGGGTASVTNAGTVRATTIGLRAVTNGGGLASVSNAVGGTVSVTGITATAGLFAQGTVAILNAGTVTVDGSSGGANVSGLLPLTLAASDSATVVNTGSVQVNGGAGRAVGIGSGIANPGSGSYTNNGVLTVLGGTGTAYGFRLVGGTSAVVTDAQTAAGTATTSVTGSGSLTGVSVSGVGGPVTVNLTGVPLALNATGGTANGIAISGGTGVSVGVSTTTIGATTFGANLSVSAVASALGVGITSNGGANSVTFGGANLSVNSSTGAATGIAVSGGTDAGVAFAPGTGMSALTMSGGGASVTGVSLQGSGALSAAFGDTVSATATAGTATGVLLAGGTSQTVTLSKGLSVGAAGGGATGLSLQGLSAAPAIAVHAAGTITVSGTGVSPVTGIAAVGASALTIDGAPAIAVAGGDRVFGVDANGGTGAIGATVGAVTVVSTTTTANAEGLSLLTAGPVTLVDMSAIDVTGGGTNFSVDARTTGAVGAIALTLGTVRLHGAATTGSGVGVQAVNGTTGTDATTVTVQQVQTSGQNAVGIAVVASPGGAGTVTIGSVTGGVHSGGVATTGSASAGVSFLNTNGPITVVNNGLISTAGTDSPGIVGTATGTGGIMIANWQTAVTGANSSAIQATTTTGAISITSTSASAGGSAVSNAISAVASGAAAVTVSLADGGSTTSASGRGVFVSTGGTSAITVGGAAGTASVSAGLWGIDSTATGGTTLVNRGTVTGGGGAAIRLAGGTDTVTNTGTVTGFVSIGSTADTFANSGTFTLTGDSTFGATGANVLNNSGTIAVQPGSAAASTVNFLAPGTALALNNTGTITLQQGAGGTPHTGDVLNIGNAAYTGSGGARLLVDANLGNAAVGASAVQTADRLVLATGSVAGVTTLSINDLGTGTPGQFNLAGTIVVQAGAGAPGAFVLQGGTIEKGYVNYRLTQAGGVFSIVGLPGPPAFEIVRTGQQAQAFWRKTADAWADQMRAPRSDDARGVTLWGTGIFSDETDKSRPGYSVTAVNAFAFAPNLDIDNRWTGALFGLDYGLGKFGIGLVGGFGDQEGRFRADSNRLDLNGYTVGGYVRWQDRGVFADALFKYDGYSVKQTVQAPSFRIDFRGATYGVEAQAGYHWVSHAFFAEPVVSLSWTRTDLDTATSKAAGATIGFGHPESVYGDAGVRIGAALPSGQWTITPYAGAYAEGDLSRTGTTTIAAGPTALGFGDSHGKAGGRFEAGIVGRAKSGFALSGTVTGITGGSSGGITGRVGLSYHW